MKQHYAPIPTDLANDYLARGIRRIIVTMNGLDIRRAIQSSKEGDRFILLGIPLLREMRVGFGDMIEITMRPDPEPDLVDGWADRGGSRSATWTEVPFAWASSDAEGLDLAWDRMRFGAAGWKVMAELPNPVNFDAACAPIPRATIGDNVPHGPDPKAYVHAVQEFVDAGFENIAIVPIGDDLGATLDFWDEEVRPLLTSTSESGASGR